MRLSEDTVIRVVSTATCVTTIALALTAPVTAGSADPFPEAEPETQGVRPEALKAIARDIGSFVDNEKVVGAEIVVIKNRRTVFHRAFGWRDVEDERLMRRHTLFSVRSMMTPITGTAVQMLIDEGRLSPDDPVAEYIPAFDNEKSRAITIDHLLTHRAGLPHSMGANADVDHDVRLIAMMAGEHGPEFEPGSRFRFSEVGSDTLAAVVAQVTGERFEAFVHRRIFSPLGMKDTMTRLRAGDPRRSRIASLYVGTQGEWIRFWKPDDEPMQTRLTGSQGLYCSPMDYARFLAMWIDGGTVHGRQFVSQDAVRRALTPVSELVYPTGFVDLRVAYGRMWMLYVERVQHDEPGGAEQIAPRPTVLTHNGLDGTWAWAWPELDLIIVYCTQSRGNATGIQLESTIDRTLIHPDSPRDLSAMPEDLAPYVGTYVANFGPYRNAEFTVIDRDGGLAVDIPGKIMLELKPPDEHGRWVCRLFDQFAVSFVKDEQDRVTVMRYHEDEFTAELPKGEALPLPNVTRADVEPYLGFYRDAESDHDVEVVFLDGRLAILRPGLQIPLELYPPDNDGLWHLRIQPSIAVRFNRDESGRVVSYTAHGPAGEAVRERIDATRRDDESRQRRTP
jgi:CubicO group peptidase (beta-lactamase class C family)